MSLWTIHIYMYTIFTYTQRDQPLPGGAESLGARQGRTTHSVVGGGKDIISLWNIYIYIYIYISKLKN